MVSATDASMTPAEEQEKWLADAMNQVKQQAFYMKRSLDGNNLREALKYSAQMLGELRTSKLSPQKYYELYIRLADELRHLEMYFEDESKRGRSSSELYEQVQHSANVLPRLYLLCTVGSVYIKSKEAPAKDVLKDLVEMSRGVQHPIRGLFLRSYLTQISKDKLPDVGSEYEGEGGNVTDAVEFVLQNFTEMNKLWVRMQKHQGAAREKEKREKERSELRDLVGKNLHVLSQLEGVDLEMYKGTVLPRVLEQIVNCKDEIAQYYLMDCLIQVFPDEYHLQTLETLLGACPQLLATVDVKTVMSQLMDRLANFAARSPEVVPELLQVDAFPKLSSAVTKVLEANADMPLVGSVSLYVALLKFVLKVHPERLDFVDHVLAGCVRCLDTKGGSIKDSKAIKQITLLLTAPLEQYKDFVVVLGLAHYSRVMHHLEGEANKAMAIVIVQSILKNATQIGEPDKVELLFELLKDLIRDVEGGIPIEEADMEDTAEEQNLVARVVHLLVNEDPETQFEVLSIAKKHFDQGGALRLVHTLPAVVFSTLKLVKLFVAAELHPQKVFQFLQSTVEVVAGVAPELGLRLFLECAESSSDCGLEDVSYEFFTQAFILYEEEISDSKAQITGLQLIIGTLQRCHVFGSENRDTLTHKTMGYAARLLKKPEQCRAVYACAHLFWSSDKDVGFRDGEKVLQCLKRSLKIANAAQQMSAATRGTGGSVTLFVEILNKYLYFFDKGCAEVGPPQIQGLLELIAAEMASDSGVSQPAADPFYESTVAYIQEQKSNWNTGERYREIQL
eukprot:TRINITY_DN3378_c0_g1_i1.p1 TRINITY_DN3378_c0_g1~~TRINITY_DN3378_c0_g1_i1.p1  ORF type:complete len:854 (+),score=150.46 TRINITY_DN3378_c0_g1_i1:195-2564(+)